jgi:23S rRNA (cytosine1962-C5)-methyltransferase
MHAMVSDPKSLIRRLLAALHEDRQCLAVDKPAGVDVGGLAEHATPGIIELLTSLGTGNHRLYVVNRLSRYESGVLLFAKSAELAARIRTAWKAGSIAQEYIAVVRGRMAKPNLVLGAGRQAAGETSRGRAAKARRRPARAETNPNATSLRRIEQGEQRSLVQCRTRASTTHALRAELRSAGLRLLGDRLHDRSPRPAADRETCLHLSRVRFALRDNERPLALHCDPPAAFRAALAGHRDFERPIVAALIRRLPVLLEPGTDACRLLSEHVEDVPGLVVERFGDVLIFQVRDATPKLAATLLHIASAYRDVLGIESVYLKRFVKDRTGKDTDLEHAHRSARPFFGRPAPERVGIVERGIHFAIRPYDGFSVGLFLDQRDNRSRVRELAAGKDVLNLFAYTCGFSVAAALGGAKQTVSVDVAPKHLEWGKTNFALNDIDLADHFFFRSDAKEFLARAKRQGRSFDLVLLDPPSFAHGRGSKGDFSVLTDLPALVAAATEVLRPDGVLMISINHRRMSHKDLRARVNQGLAGRRHEIIVSPSLPPDFAMDPDHAKSLWIRVAGRQQVATQTGVG